MGEISSVAVDGVAVLKEIHKNVEAAAMAGANKDEGKRSMMALKVPPRSIFGNYPERYLSPTDSLVSPISRGLLARNRRSMSMFVPPVPPKALETTFIHVGAENCAAK